MYISIIYFTPERVFFPTVNVFELIIISYKRKHLYKAKTLYIFLGANAPLGPALSEAVYVCLYVCMYVTF